MTTAIARYDGPRTITELQQYAATLAGTRTDTGYNANQALPTQYRGNPAALAFAVEYAKALDVSPITAITGIHYIEGKPSASAGLINALVRRAGHQLRVALEGSLDDLTLKAVATLVRVDDPDHTYRSEWTLQRAERADLLTLRDGKVHSYTGQNQKPGNWMKYTENMLKARVITEVCRDGAEDALMGVHYTPEELGAEVNDAGEPVVTSVPERNPQPAPATVRVEQVRDDQQAPAAAPKADDTPQSDDQASTDPAVTAIADAFRTRVLTCTTRDQLEHLWTDGSGPLGHNGVAENQKARATALFMGDHRGVETNGFDLFAAQAKAIAAGTPLVDEVAGQHGDQGGPDGDQAGDVIHCEHGVPETHYCGQCEPTQPGLTDEPSDDAAESQGR